MHWFTQLFLVFLAAGTALRLWLSARQRRAVRGGRERVPAPFDAQIDLAAHHKAADYTLAGSRLGTWETLYDTLLLVGWTLGGGIALLDRAWLGLELDPVLSGTAVIMSALIVMSLLALPFTVYRTFRLEAEFGFNRSSPGLFISDQLKGLVLMLVLGVPLVALILWLMRAAGTFWWLYAWVVWVGFSLLMTWAFPTWIAPLFNKFQPLADASLRERIEALLERCGFRSNGIFVMDGSRRSSHGNAYFTGVGNNKRIVFFDTLIESLEPLEVEAVLAHELGHFRMRHVRKRLIASFALSLAGLALLGWLVQQGWFFSALGVGRESAHAALLLFLLVAPVFSYPLTPLSAYLSRRHEFEADAYAAQQSDAQALVHALVKLYRDNATTLTPDPLHSGFYDSHPPAPLRVARLAAIGPPAPAHSVE